MNFWAELFKFDWCGLKICCIVMNVPKEHKFAAFLVSLFLNTHLKLVAVIINYFKVLSLATIKCISHLPTAAFS